MKPRTDITRFGKIKNKTKNWYSFSGNKTIALNAQKKASKRLTRERERESYFTKKRKERERAHKKFQYNAWMWDSLMPGESRHSREILLEIRI